MRRKLRGLRVFSCPSGSDTYLRHRVSVDRRRMRFRTHKEKDVVVTRGSNDFVYEKYEEREQWTWRGLGQETTEAPRERGPRVEWGDDD